MPRVACGNGNTALAAARQSPTSPGATPTTPGVPSPVGWGDATNLRSLFGEGVEIRAHERTFHFGFPPQRQTRIATEYPPIAAALARFDDEQAASRRRDIEELANQFDVGSGDGLVMPWDYLEVVVHNP